MVPGLRAEGVPPKGGGPGPAKPHSIFVQVTWLALPPGRQPSLPLDFIPDLPLGPGAPVPPHVVALTPGPPMREGLGCPEGRLGGLCPEQWRPGFSGRSFLGHLRGAQGVQAQGVFSA